jgi:uncharacterized protein YutE (UPF0331/DUF86 family)
VCGGGWGKAALVDAEQVENRLERLEAMLELLQETREAGEEAYLADAQQRLATERLLQLSIQICIDLAAQVVSEQSAPPPSSYSDVFKILGDKGVISGEIAERLGNAARQRNLLVHLYMEIDDRAVFASLAFLDDLREFATIVGRLAESDAPTD